MDAVAPNMKKIIIFFILTFVYGCWLSWENYKPSCEKKYSEFVDIYDCTKETLDENIPDWRDREHLRFFMLRGENLLERLNAGEISNEEAKYRW